MQTFFCFFLSKGSISRSIKKKNNRFFWLLFHTSGFTGLRRANRSHFDFILYLKTHKWMVMTAGNKRHCPKLSHNGTTFVPGSSWQCDSVTGLTWQATDIHLLQVLGLQNDHGQFASSGHIPQRETDVTQLLLLWVAEKSSIRDIIVKINRKTEPENLVKFIL